VGVGVKRGALVGRKHAAAALRLLTSAGGGRQADDGKGGICALRGHSVDAIGCVVDSAALPILAVSGVVVSVRTGGPALCVCGD